MGARRIRILFVPDGEGGVKQVAISLPLLVLVLFILACSAASACFLIRDYLRISAQMPQLFETQKERDLREREFAHLRLRVDQLDDKVEALLSLDEKLRTVADLEANHQDVGMLAMGGSELKSAQPAEQGGVAGTEATLVPIQGDAVVERRAGELKRVSDESPLFPTHSQVLFGTRTPRWPAKGFILAGFGTRVSPVSGQTEFHKGIDISTRLHAPVVAASDGVVTSVGWEPGLGRVLSINHGFGLTTFYGRLEEISVIEGEYVRTGKQIAVVGNGDLNGPHLHYEIRLGGVAVNPLQFAPEETHLRHASFSR